MRLLSFVLAVLVSASSVCVAADEPTPEEKAARTYSLENMNLGTSFADFKKKYPTAILMNSPYKNVGVNSYVRDVGPEGVAAFLQGTMAPTISCSFFEGKIYEYDVGYFQKYIDDQGGFDVFAETFVKKFGKSEVSKEDGKVRMTWTFPKVEREITLQVNDLNVTSVTVVDSKVLRKVLEKKKRLGK